MSDFQTKFAKFQFGRTQRVRLYRQLERLLRNGVPLHRALEALYNRASRDGKKKDHPEAIAIDTFNRIYKSGKSFGTALSGWVPYQEQMLIEAGELSGDLSRALKDVVEVSQGTSRIKGALVGGLAYPMVLLFTTLAMVYMFGVQIIPPFAEISPTETWEGGAAQMAWLARSVETWTLPVLGVIFAAITLYMSTVSVWKGRGRVIVDRFPPWSMYRMWQGSGFMLSLSALIRAGVPVPEALRRIRRNANPYLVERIDLTLRHINSGANLGEALMRAKCGFPDQEIIQDLRIYASLSNFEDALEMIAKEWIEEGVARVQAQSKTLNNLMLFFLAGVIGWLGWGLFEVQKTVTAAANSGVN